MAAVSSQQWIIMRHLSCSLKMLHIHPSQSVAYERKLCACVMCVCVWPDDVRLALWCMPMCCPGLTGRLRMWVEG